MEAPNGSRWYYVGKHWEVVRQTSHDGAPAVWVRNLKTRKRLKVKIEVSRLLKYGRKSYA